MNRTIFKAGKKYTFSDYFEMNYPIEEILQELGYSWSLQEILFPINQDVDPVRLERLKTSYYELLPKITLNSEAAKREFMIAPVLQEVIRPLDAKLHIEYPLEVDDKLGGTLDYLICTTQQMVVVEAKRGDLDRGFNQLAAELIALDKYERQAFSAVLYGTITIGEVWRFGLLDRAHQQIVKGIQTFRFPEDLAEIFGILTGILSSQDGTTGLSLHYSHTPAVIATGVPIKRRLPALPNFQKLQSL